MVAPYLTVPYLGVQFTDSSTVTFTNPTPYTCFQFSSCPYWRTSRYVVWKKLDAKQYAVFYESDKCNSKGEYHFVSNLKSPASGSFTFKKNRAIRSMMVGEISDTFSERSITYLNNCSSDKESTTVNDTSIYVISGSDDDENGLSSNCTKMKSSS
ncbi:Hypothetical protein PHPALM_3210 [Phytophthora palmivora]|uniref:Uncharacterized protein n=1 Tax=Phytophthora palmivora TaxID=4796 RepID=A0A2P4YMX4_9STRA|nr:Hypothetical protein PHPALM_3210 [Phytophthora palmivora]